MEKNKGNKARVVSIFIIGILVLVLVIWLLLQFASSYKNNNPSQTIPAKPIVVPTDEPLLTPTTVPSSRANWKTFIFSDPATQYSFDYPSSWDVVEIRHDNLVRLNFVGHCRVEFSTNGSKNKALGNKTTDSKTYGGRTFVMTTLKKNNNPYSEMFSLSDATSKDGFTMVTVDLPSANISQCQQVVDQILSSLQFGK